MAMLSALMNVGCQRCGSDTTPSRVMNIDAWSKAGASVSKSQQASEVCWSAVQGAPARKTDRFQSCGTVQLRTRRRLPLVVAAADHPRRGQKYWTAQLEAPARWDAALHSACGSEPSGFNFNISCVLASWRSPVVARWARVLTRVLGG